MPPLKRVKEPRREYRTVAVIATAAELGRAARMHDPPDLFEIRLDCLFSLSGLETKVTKLPAPVIITARDPAEGGENNLSVKMRRELLLRFLPLAAYVDIELRAMKVLRTVLDRQRGSNVGNIISFHDFRSTPTLGSLRAKAAKAKTLRANIFKVATRVDTPAQLGRLLEFVGVMRGELPVTAMGIGRLGAISRLLLAQCGCPLIYTSLGAPRVEGQMSLRQFRNTLRQSRL